MTPLHTQILTARDRNGQELRTIQKQLQKLPPGKLICSRNRTTVKWYQGDGHSKTYIPKANRTLAEQLALKKYLQQQEQILLQEQAAITAYLKYSPAGSLSSDDPHLLSDPACEDLLRSYSSTSKNIPDISNVSDIPNILTRSAVEWSAASYERNPLHPEQLLHKTVSGEIFLTGNGKSLSRRQIWAEMKRLCVHAGVEPSKVFPHNLRHCFATAYYRAYRDIAKLADVLGHSSIETTRIYLLTSGAEHQRQLDRLGLVS